MRRIIPYVAPAIVWPEGAKARKVMEKKLARERARAAKVADRERECLMALATGDRFTIVGTTKVVRLTRRAAPGALHKGRGTDGRSAGGKGHRFVTAERPAVSDHAKRSFALSTSKPTIGNVTGYVPVTPADRREGPYGTQTFRTAQGAVRAAHAKACRCRDCERFIAARKRSGVTFAHVTDVAERAAKIAAREAYVAAKSAELAGIVTDSREASIALRVTLDERAPLVHVPQTTVQMMSREERAADAQALSRDGWRDTEDTKARKRAERKAAKRAARA